ncbi:MAG: DUF3800 domain-containing protein, partial [Chthoniobacterales bacterium]
MSRFIYIDESGISANEKVLVVAGVIVNADLQLKGVETALCDLRDNYLSGVSGPAGVNELERQNFFFHAKDMFHGSGSFFDRRTYPLD